MKRFGLAGLMLLALAQPAPAQFLRGAGDAQKWGPNGNGTLKHEDDVQWLAFHDARITANRDAGIYSAAFGPFLRRMDGQHIAITGYIMPLESTSSSMHFVLTRRSPGCPFCPPNEPTEAIEIFSATLVKATPAPITIEGKLRLVASSATGLFFRIDGAKAW